jgi:hypothetical protein
VTGGLAGAHASLVFTGACRPGRHGAPDQQPLGIVAAFVVLDLAPLAELVQAGLDPVA